ncbi:alpha/beta hydrolase [Aurantiacibacter gilvus]|uniref:Alpha/beta hydrolase n=1 Tax=Aurantiacibacter gilvus TaxID=3139141 RepID=A0ABU9IFV3_9SPHN
MLKAALGFLAALLITATATAQPDPSMFAAEVVPPVQGELIPLPTVDPQSENAEQWNRVFGQVWVRNVSHPGLYRVAPKNGRGNGRAVIVVPGGGYSFVSIESEGFWVAERLAAQGYTAFVLKYRPRTTPAGMEEFIAALVADFGNLGQRQLPDHPPAVDDLAAAITLIRERAAEWEIDPGSIGAIGFSAGSRTTIRLLENHPEAALLDHVGLIYPPMAQTIAPGPRPDLFMAIAVDDPLFRQGGLTMVDSWLAESQAVEFHLYSGGEHGFGLRPQGTTSDLWIDQYLAWLALQ